MGEGEGEKARERGKREEREREEGGTERWKKCRLYFPRDGKAEGTSTWTRRVLSSRSRSFVEGSSLHSLSERPDLRHMGPY